MQYEILHQDHLVWVYYCACGVCFLFFLLGRNHKSICSGEALRSEKMQPGMRSWWWTNGWKECRCVIVFGASRHQLAWLCLVGKKPLPGEQPVADLQLEVTVVGFWWEYPLHNLQRDFVDQSLARGLPTFLACLPWWGSRSTRCSQFSHEGYVHYDSWPGWQADTLQLLTFCWVFNCRWWMHHEHDGKVGCDGNL